jgi:GMP reductase
MLDELKDIKFICLDVANGYQGSFIKRVEFYRTHFPSHILIAGNVVTSEIT